MAIFNGKIIEAYFTNAENTAVEVIYKDGDKAICHYLPVDYNLPDFKDLIEEYSTDKISEATIARNRNYARQLSDIVDEGIASKTEIKQKISVSEFVSKLLDYDDTDDQSKEIFFTMKLQAFELAPVKQSTDKDAKSQLRSAKNPIQLIKCLERFND